MPPVTKEAQRAELHKTIWRIANDLRGSVDGWDFKSYVLGMLFYRFISENLTAYINKGEHEAGDSSFDYADLSDAEAELGRAVTVAEKGFYILPSELFQNVRKRAAHDPNLNETLELVFKDVEGSALGTDSENDLKGLFDDLDVNSSKLGNTVARRNEKLVKLLDAVGDLPLGNFEDNSIDLFGDAYEYLMQMYASQAGKSGGEYYTPQEVSELLARITVMGKDRVNKVYDPACGSGSLLLKFAKVLGRGNVGGFYGQEINLTTYNLARINMFLHEVNYEQFDIAHGDTLLDPQHWDEEPFEAIVSNPPYSIRWDGDANPLLINDERFAPAGVLAPKSKADLAFTMHILSWLAVDGTAAIVEFPGVLYRGGAEQKIRKYLIDNNYVDAVIQLPPDLFFGTGIPTCIIVLKKSKRDNSVLFVDASAEFTRGGSKNKLSPENQEKILQALELRVTSDHFAELVANEEVASHSYNLAVSSYVGARDNRELIDIGALNAEVIRILRSQATLRAEIDNNDVGLAQLEKSPIHEVLREMCPDGVPYVSIGDPLVSQRVVSGATPSSGVAEFWENGTIPWMSSGEVNKGTVFATDKLITPAALAATSTKMVPSGAVVIALAGQGRTRGTVARTRIDLCTNQSLAAIVVAPTMASDFLYHYLRTQYQQLRELSSGDGSRGGLNLQMIRSYKVPVPPIEIQLEIVRVLDRFTTLEAELEASLEAEIAARRRQWGYYRDRLLSFVNSQD